MDDATVNLGIFLLLFNLLLPPFAYALTTFGDSMPTVGYDITIDQDDLIDAGIQFRDAQSENVTYKGGYVNFNVSDQFLRVDWNEIPIIGTDYFSFEKPSRVEKILGDQTGNYYTFGGRELNVEVNDEVYEHTEFLNSTVMVGWNDNYNWTRVEILETDLTCLITIPSHFNSSLNNETIIDAIYDHGILGFTVGEAWNSTDSYDFKEFGSWYWGLLSGTKSYGLPDYLEYFLRIFFALQIFGAVVVTRDLIGFT